MPDWRGAGRAGSQAGGIVAGAILMALPFTQAMPAGAFILCIFIGGIVFVRSWAGAIRDRRR